MIKQFLERMTLGVEPKVLHSPWSQHKRGTCSPKNGSWGSQNICKRHRPGNLLNEDSPCRLNDLLALLHQNRLFCNEKECRYQQKADIFWSRYLDRSLQLASTPFNRVLACWTYKVQGNRLILAHSSCLPKKKECQIRIQLQKMHLSALITLELHGQVSNKPYVTYVSTIESLTTMFYNIPFT